MKVKEEYEQESLVKLTSRIINILGDIIEADTDLELLNTEIESNMNLRISYELLSDVVEQLRRNIIS